MLFNVWNQDNILVKVINIIAKDHNRWITIAKSFGLKDLRNLFLDKVKKQKKIIKLSDTFYEPSISAMSMEYQERLDFVKSEIDTWSLYHKKIYELVFLEGKSIQWLSDKTGIEYHTVRRAVQKIKKNINLKLKQK